VAKEKKKEIYKDRDARINKQTNKQTNCHESKAKRKERRKIFLKR